ncbi:hypothetical protein PHYSODRAFT_252207 [Phytophthora sojae]|uniref:Uncharacterized protein n=1 Tax=Phytophthora sojae (strain P6497) TaxID=1094619 RepID=G4ZAE6_PHYSP|nr:hypothetical protein PHYSODRAFT_252207 [Phytophthora sojae]EGZ22661.1 hypothetical protein PHYSODRAFT_252207 [Phytophthora sojae]|eukprot:XP_009525378.1 hypothetical protein PHYSODRAFT_252207 [Phytophthora sojae]
MQLFTPIVFALALLSVGVQAKVKEETKSIDDLYAEAVAEGGKLVLYHGGDTPTQQDSLHEAFQQRFPEINFTLIVDYSKYHDVRIDNQLETDTLVPDVVALQTLQDFPRWARGGKIHKSLKASDGAWMAYTVYSFASSYNASNLNGLTPPATVADLVNSQWAGKIASSYPNDDDAVLYLYTRYLANQSVAFHRGSNVAGELIASGEKLISMGSDVGVSVVGCNSTEYIAWGQRAAILAKAKHPAAAKLFMNWALSDEVQASTVAPSVRTDINTDKPWDIPEANMTGFSSFMEDRANVEEWKQTFSLYFGEVQGEPTPGFIGLYPGL